MSLTDSEKQYLKLIRQTYKSIHDREDVDDLLFLHHFSNDDFSVYYDKNSEKHIMAIKGTNTIEQFLESSNILLNNSTGYIKKIDRNYNKLPEEVRKNIIITGHSLGGLIASELSRKYKKKGLAVAPYAPIENEFIFNALTKSPKMKKIVSDSDLYFNNNYFKLNDKLTKIKKVVHKKSSTFLPYSHQMDSFFDTFINN